MKNPAFYTCPDCGKPKTFNAAQCRDCANISRSRSLKGRMPKNTFEGGNASRLRHGHTWKGGYSPTYGSWASMRQRCKPDGKYGVKGITVCERWESFDNFLADMGERPEGMTLDRRDNSKGYEPSNCRWATDAEQAENSDRTGPRRPPTEPAKKCKPGCACGRHRPRTRTWSAAKKCPEGCTCGRHNQRKLDPEVLT